MFAEQLLIPVKKCKARAGVFQWPTEVVLAGGPEDETALMLLAEDLYELGLTSVGGDGSDLATLHIRRGKEVRDPEGYRLDITPAGITLTSSTPAGAYYGVATLRELVRVYGLKLPCGIIEDWPDFRRRGVYHDCSRGKVPKLETLMDLVERLASWKINELQLYVENVFTFKKHPDIGQGYSPFTPEEITALQEHCKKHHVRLVGSLATLGHSEKILELPRYRKLGELPGFHGMAGGLTFCPTDPGAIRLVRDLLEEYIPLHEAEDFNVCGDEVEFNGRSRQRAFLVGIGRVYTDYMLQVYAICQRLGKRMNVWADIVLQHPNILAEWPKDVVMLNWEYYPQGPNISRTHEIVDAGLPVVVCPGTSAWASNGCRLEMGMNNIANFAEEGLKQGAEGLLNTDWGDNRHRNMLAISLHNFAWGAAHSWNHKGTDEKGFAERFGRHTFPALDRVQIAKCIRVLGSGDKMLHHPDAGYSMLDCIFNRGLECFYQADNCVAEQLRVVKVEYLRNYLTALESLEWPEPAADADEFTLRTLAEFELSTRMEALSCRRAWYLKARQNDEQPAKKDVARLVEDTQAMLEVLPQVWRLGNKPSRLVDTLAELKKILKEYKK